MMQKRALNSLPLAQFQVTRLAVKCSKQEPLPATSEPVQMSTTGTIKIFGSRKGGQWQVQLTERSKIVAHISLSNNTGLSPGNLTSSRESAYRVTATKDSAVKAPDQAVVISLEKKGIFATFARLFCNLIDRDGPASDYVITVRFCRKGKVEIDSQPADGRAGEVRRTSFQFLFPSKLKLLSK